MQTDEIKNSKPTLEQVNIGRNARCEWCDKEMPENENDHITQGFLTGVFGYRYCSNECLESHIYSK